MAQKTLQYSLISTLYNKWNFCPRGVTWWQLRENCPLKKILMAIFGFSGPKYMKISGSTLWFKKLFLFCVPVLSVTHYFTFQSNATSTNLSLLGNLHGNDLSLPCFCWVLTVLLTFLQTFFYECIRYSACYRYSDEYRI